MLEPSSRSLLLDALRPPLGYVLDQAVATTFTLDLETAITVPLAFAGYSLRETADTIELLEALRSSMERINIFCQAGAIKATRWPSDLVGLLDPAIHDVPRPNKGCIFHPKVWVVRYRCAETDAPSYRCLVLSRNLTADRSWDMVLRLDSDDANTRVNEDNSDLWRLIAGLPDASRMPADSPRRSAIQTLSSDLRKVNWQLPDDVHELDFHAFGIRGKRNPNLADLFTGYRHLIVSPFISEGGLRLITKHAQSSDLHIISRSEELDKLDPGSVQAASIQFISPAIANLDGAEASDAAPATEANQLSDLHAKLYVVESNRAAYLLMGSANATESGLNGGNVELVCRMKGGATKLGVDHFIGEKSPLRSILENYTFPDTPSEDTEGELTHQLDSYLFDLASEGMAARVTAVDDLWQVTISLNSLPEQRAEWAPNLALAPFNRAGDLKPLRGAPPFTASFGPMPAHEITPFVLVVAEVDLSGQRMSARCVVRAALEGDPDRRIEDLIIRQIDTPEKFLRLLELLLGLSASPSVLSGRGPHSDAPASWGDSLQPGILETLTEALALNPDGLIRLDRIVSRLSESERGNTILPAGWPELWRALQEARVQIQEQA